MQGDYGRNVIGSTGIPIYVEATGQGEYAPVGITLDWSLVAALGSDTLVPNQQLTVKSGQKYLRYGQVLAKVTNANIQTLTISGTPTGGTFTLSGYRNDTGGYVTTAPIAYNASAATVLAALADVGVFNTTSITVTGSAGGPYTITTPLALLTGNGAGLTGGTAPAATVVMTTPIANAGMYGPYDFAATDGRQTLVNGQCCILNSTVLQNGILGSFTQLPANHPGVLVGGMVWKARLIATSGTHSLANGPTFTELLAALPRLAFCGMS